jgi:hypothetical protein
MSLGDPPIRKPASEKPEPQDVQVAPHVWRKPDGTMYTKHIQPGNVPPRKPKPAEATEQNERDDVDWGWAC